LAPEVINKFYPSIFDVFLFLWSVLFDKLLSIFWLWTIAFQSLTRVKANSFIGSNLKIPSFTIEFTPLPIRVSVKILAVIGKFERPLTNFLNTLRSLEYYYSFLLSPIVIYLFSRILRHIWYNGGIPKLLTYLCSAGWALSVLIMMFKNSI